MGLFSEAAVRTEQAERYGLGAGPASTGLGALPAPPPLGLVQSPELESAADLILSRLARPSAPSHCGFVVAHWEPGEGASTLAAALAFRGAQLNPAASFCLADCDFFKPDLTLLVGLEAEPGISNVLCGQLDLDDALAATRLANLHILPAGYPNIGRRVAQWFDRCRQVCQQLLERFDWVLFDVPALRDHPNFALWAGQSARSILVVRAGKARRQAVAKAAQTLKLMGLPPAAVALNRRQYYLPQWLYSWT